MRNRISVTDNSSVKQLPTTNELKEGIKRIREYIRTRPINFDLANMGIPPIKVIWQNTYLQHERVYKSFPVMNIKGM